MPDSDPVVALIVPCVLTTVVMNWVLPGANEEIHEREFFWLPSL